MKKSLNLIILFFFFIVVGSFAQTTYYYNNSTGTGALDNPSNWWTGVGGTGT